MTKLEKKLRAKLRRIGIEPGSPVVVAVSGGADSTALLDALTRLRDGNGGIIGEICVAHLNHLLRGEESDQDEKFVKELAERMSLKCYTAREPVTELAKELGQNLEATARQLRYRFLLRTAESCNAGFILTAHTRDDQVETILMRLLRGSGADGLKGIEEEMALGEWTVDGGRWTVGRTGDHFLLTADNRQPTTDNRPIKLIRPMLDVTRTEVIEHCEKYGIRYRIDSSNFSADFTRNRVRGELLPMLRTFNPRVDEALIRTAAIIGDDDDCLEQLASELLSQTRSGAAIEIKPLIKSHPALRRRVLRLWLDEIQGGLKKISSVHINAIERLLSEGQSGQMIQLPGDNSVLRQFDRLILVGKTLLKEKSPIAPADLVPERKLIFGDYSFLLWRNVPRGSLHIVDGKMFHPQISGMSEFEMLHERVELDGLRIRGRMPGDAYTPDGRRHNIKLKTLLIRHKVPLILRDTYPVVVTSDDEIVWSPGLPAASGFAVEAGDSVCALIIAEKGETAK